MKITEKQFEEMLFLKDDVDRIYRELFRIRNEEFNDPKLTVEKQLGRFYRRDSLIEELGKANRQIDRLVREIGRKNCFTLMLRHLAK